MPVGRPRKYKSVKQMQVAIDDYFATTQKITITGLALHLGFTSRQDLINYQGYSPEYYDALKGAKSKVEQYYEEHIIGQNAAGPIFALKNFNWSDKQQIEHSGDMGVNIISFKNSDKVDPDEDK